MRYLSVCSGIEAATQGWHPLGWTPVAFSEIEKFPSAALAHHYPDVPNWGDMTKFKEWPDATVDVLVGGTPCQSFSVAGLRKGLDDPRGNLALTYLAIAEQYRPEWLVWENVPGVLSADGGRAFGAIIGGMVELGYCPAWRVLDAQYVRTQRFFHAVPQRRRRVFVVAHLGDWRRAAAVLFDSESLRGNPAPRRKAGQAAPTIPLRSAAGGGCGTDFDCDGGVIDAQQVSAPLGAGDGHRGFRNDLDQGAFIPEVANPLTHRMHKGINTTADEGQTPLPVAFGHPVNLTGYQGDRCVGDGDAHPALSAQGGNNGGPSGALMMSQMAVRRLTPAECERLQGFPDSFTAIPWRGKPAENCPDGPRYKALGNSMAVNCMEWIGQRIQMVSEVQK